MTQQPSNPEARAASSITITYEDALPSVLSKNGRSKTHWRKVRDLDRELRELGFVLILKAVQESHVHLDGGIGAWITPKFQKATITVHQYWCGKALDDSGLAAASAALVDAFVDAGVIPDDDPYTVTLLFGATRVPHRNQRRVTVTVTEEVT